MVKLGLGATLGLSGIAIIGVLAFVFRDKISDFFSTITGGAEAASTASEITNTALDTLQGSQQGILDTLNSLTNTISGLFNQTPQPPPETFTPPVKTDEVIVAPLDLSNCQCGGHIEQQFGISFGVCNKCQSGDGQLPSQFPPENIPQECIEIPQIGGGSFNSCSGVFTPSTQSIPSIPIIDPLPPGFETGGLGTGDSNVTGTIFETPITCNSTLGFIIDKLGVTASQAADIRAQACGDFGDFDFGSNTGSGISPTNPNVITGGATLQSEEQKAACVTCEMFGLNCPICKGSI